MICCVVLDDNDFELAMLAAFVVEDVFINSIPLG